MVITAEEKMNDKEKAEKAVELLEKEYPDFEFDIRIIICTDFYLLFHQTVYQIVHFYKKL